MEPIHGEASLRESSLDFWRAKETEGIIASLAPGARDPLVVSRAGRIVSGNHRVTVLRERGVDVEWLPRVIHESHEIEDPSGG